MTRPTLKKMHKGKTILGGLVIAMLVSAGVLMGAPVEAQACLGFRPVINPKPVMKKQQDGRWAVKVTYKNKYYSFRNGNFRLQKVTVLTRDKRFAKWIVRHHKGHVWNAVRKAAHTKTCTDLIKRLSVLEKTIAVGVAKAYKAKTRRATAKPDLMIESSKPYRAYCRPATS